MNPNRIVDSLLNEDGAGNRELAALVSAWMTDKVDAAGILSKLREFEVISDEEAKNEDTYVEPGSKEHGVIHVFLNNNADTIVTVQQDGVFYRESSFLSRVLDRVILPNEE